LTIEKQPSQKTDLNKFKINEVFSAQSKNRWKIANSSVKVRITKLKKVENWILENKQEIRDAIYSDFNKPAVDVDLTEIYTVLSEARHARKHLKKWLRQHPVRRTLALISTRSWVQYEARGTVLIIAPWNYPFSLNIAPLISAIAAGNCAIIKPSELSKHTSKLISRMVSDLFPENEVAVFEGEKDVAKELLKLPFDHIFFTGSTGVGKKIMAAAAKNLSTLTLELGGKSPTIVDKSANIKDAAEKIVWSKFMNSGQTCIAPDYLLVHKSIATRFKEHLKSIIQKFYSDTNYDNYARIIDNNHYNRLANALEESTRNGAKIEVSNNLNINQKLITPTILSNISTDSEIMTEEIFGPLLPLVIYENTEEAVAFINERPKPLALYVFSHDKPTTDIILKKTTSGGVCINDAVIYFSQINLPFGGVNSSGMGRTHGFHGFKTFSNEKAILRQGKFSPLKLVYPPYTNRVQKIVDLMLKYL